MRQQRWVELFQEYDFDILYWPGKDNVVADSLNRKSFLNVISIPDNPIIAMTREASTKDPEYQNLLALISTRDSSGIPHPSIVNFSCSDGCLYYRERLCIPKDQSLKKPILYKAHDSPTSGHLGYAKTLNDVRKSYHWVGLKGDILRYVRQCLSCQRIKAERVKMPGKLQPLDMLTKVSYLIPVKVTYTASDIARIFVKEIFRIHGLPKRIVSDRDAKFTSKLWTSLFQAINTQLCFSLAYHPQSDGQIKRVNQVVEDILRAYCSREPSKWMQYLPLVEYAYNSSYHQSIGRTPFNALYGQECLSPRNFSDPTIRVEASRQMIEEMESQTKAIRKDIQAAQDRQKHYADGKRSDRQFHERDKVFLRVRPKRSTLLWESIRSLAQGIVDLMKFKNV